MADNSRPDARLAKGNPYENVTAPDGFNFVTENGRKKIFKEGKTTFSTCFYVVDGNGKEHILKVFNPLVNNQNECIDAASEYGIVTYFAVE
jgi:hypothetical protein